MISLMVSILLFCFAFLWVFLKKLAGDTIVWAKGTPKLRSTVESVKSLCSLETGNFELISDGVRLK